MPETPKTQPMCEVCRKSPAISFSHFKDREPGKRWMFTCMCTSEKETYYIELGRFYHSSRSAVGWLTHMHEKVWMDWGEFMDMLTRFHEEDRELMEQALESAHTASSGA